MEAFHLQRARFELVVERKLHCRQLADDRNVEITRGDLRAKTPPAGWAACSRQALRAFFEVWVRRQR
jgi:hypothetical protein